MHRRLRRALGAQRQSERKGDLRSGRVCQALRDARRHRPGEGVSRFAKGFAKRWIEAAADGDHYRLAFDKSGSWSQKYNLVWDKILGLDLFPAEVAQKEMAFYRKTQKQFGLPLDNRENYTKLDWIVWTATLTQDRQDFDALVSPVVAFINATPDRSPLTDWYRTTDGKKVGFTARPVVGGVFIQLLYDQNVWKKWAARDTTRAANWAAMPKPPLIKEIVPIAATQPSSWFYTTAKPPAEWTARTYDPKDWKTGKSGFGTAQTPGATIGTVWSTADIWLIRDIELPTTDVKDLYWFVHHDEGVEIYLNGELVEELPGFSVQYETRPLSAAAQRLLKPGKNRLSVHCHQTGGGQYIDIGLVTQKEQ